MKLNDPFGRMARRHQAGYEAMRDALRRSGTETAEAAWAIYTQAKKRGLNFIGIGSAILFLVTIILPQALPITLSLALLLIAWVISSTINGRRYIERYINEDLQRQEPEPEETQPTPERE
jgi:hypothetical protein